MEGNCNESGLQCERIANHLRNIKTNHELVLWNFNQGGLSLT